MKLAFIVNGDDVVVDLDGDVPMAIAVELALDQSRNFARPPEDWELRSIWGERMDPDAFRVKAFKDGDRFFLTLKVGAGGHASLRAA